LDSVDCLGVIVAVFGNAVVLSIGIIGLVVAEHKKILPVIRKSKAT